MRILRINAKDFAGIREVDVELGPGLNVLYGPNDLGKSTLAEAIRLALLLPHTSSHIDEYVPWTGGQNPVVELTFETEPQRIWRVRKEFRRGGASVLEESRNGVDFDEVERARKVDGRLRELLRWGLAEPGGSGGSKGLPSSFLATVLLSTQSNVSAVLSDSLQSDPSGTGKERIAAALQAVAQDPLFVALLRDTQARRDAAYTDKGARKTAKGSVFKEAADRLRQARDEREQLQKQVEDSEGIEAQLWELNGRLDQREAAFAAASAHRQDLERLLAGSAALAVADEQVRLAGDEVTRIRQLDADANSTAATVARTALSVTRANDALQSARERSRIAEAAFKAADEAAKAAGTDSTTTATVVRQRLELRRAAAEQQVRDAQQQIDRAQAAQERVDAAARAEAEDRSRRTEIERAQAGRADAAAREQAAVQQLGRLELIARAVDWREADYAASAARAVVDREAALRTRLEAEAGALAGLITRRTAIAVPAAAALIPMRRLATELAGARGALNVGLVVTVTPRRRLDVRVRKDDETTDVALTTEPHEIEANTTIGLDLEVATVEIRGGRPEAQRTMRRLEQRWQREVAPHLAAAGVADLDALAAQVEDARGLEAGIEARQAEVESLRAQVATLSGAAAALDAAVAQSARAREGLGGMAVEALATEIAALGADAAGAVRQRRLQLSIELDAARSKTSHAGTELTLAEERGRASKAAVETAAAARDAALAAFPEGASTALTAASGALATASDAQQAVRDETAALEATIAGETARIAAAVRDTLEEDQQARTALDAAQHAATRAVAEHASQSGRFDELRRQRQAQDLAGAERRLEAATSRRAAVPVPDHLVTDADAAAARDEEARAKAELERVVHDIQRAHGALEQVGGSVARERLRDATEAFEAAERHERELEVEYEAWLLLLQQMKEADAAQASNLGQTLAPAIAGGFESLTRQRYENVSLTAHLATEGVVVGGAVRSTDRISVGTREQLSTLYRLALAEYLKTCVVLDDQLVQSDAERMDWFRALLVDKARAFQIVVFTCRPGDYLSASAMVPKGKAVFKNTDGGLTRAVDLGKAIQRR
ncbi:MAG: AAA family ATPase [Vicinamibacterales bacterium]